MARIVSPMRQLTAFFFLKKGKKKKKDKKPLLALPCLRRYRPRWSKATILVAAALVDESQAHRQDVGTQCRETAQVFKGWDAGGGWGKNGVAKRRKEGR